MFHKHTDLGKRSIPHEINFHHGSVNLCQLQKSKGDSLISYPVISALPTPKRYWSPVALAACASRPSGLSIIDSVFVRVVHALKVPRTTRSETSDTKEMVNASKVGFLLGGLTGTSGS
jgi:hypothetical protein